MKRLVLWSLAFSIACHWSMKIVVALTLEGRTLSALRLHYRISGTWSTLSRPDLPSQTVAIYRRISQTQGVVPCNVRISSMKRRFSASSSGLNIDGHWLKKVEPIPWGDIQGLQDKRPCPKCSGEGKAPVRRSKKAQFQYKREKKAAEERGEKPPPPPPPRIERCPTCEGTGLMVLHANGMEESQNEHANDKELSQRVNTVGIVGGGIGGLALALALQQRRIPCVVYERDACFEERRQGYGLTIQQAVKALNSLGFFDGSSTENDNKPFGIKSKRHLVHTPDGAKIGEWGLRVWGRPEGKQDANRQNVHVPRQVLRRMLLDALLPGTVQWGCKLVDYQEVDSDELGIENTEGHIVCMKIDQAHANSSTSDELYHWAKVVVGADGIRSAVRKIKISSKESYPLRYLGCTVILGIAPSPSHSLTDGETVFQTADGTTRLYAMPYSSPGAETAQAQLELGKERGAGNDRDELSSKEESPKTGETMWQLSFPYTENEAIALSASGPEALKCEGIKRCGKWHAPLPELIQNTPVTLVTGYPCYDRDIIKTEHLRKGSSPLGELSQVTLIGDAAHPMSPFKVRDFYSIQMKCILPLSKR
jgi:salicylate hydroxylase